MNAFLRNRRLVYSCATAIAMVVIVLVMTTAALAGIRWSSNGVGICTQANQQWAPQVASDGYNGAIIVWQDNRNGNWDIYAQHVFSGGTVDSTWPADGVPVCTDPFDQQGPVIISDGAHGAIIAWQDARLNPNPATAIYAQRVLGLGAVDPQWTVNGTRVGTNVTGSGSEVIPRLASDGANGAFVCWRDWDTSAYAIMAQRLLEADGTRNWGDPGVAISGAAGIQDQPDMINDGANGAIISFTTGDIYAQRLTSAGALSWGANGVTVCNAANLQESATLISDNAAGAVIAWADGRTGTTRDIYAQRVLPGSGTGTVDPAWPVNGVGICTGHVDASSRTPRIASDNGNGAIIAWEDWRTGREIFAQRVTGIGTTLWTANGVLLCNAGSLQEAPQIASDMQGGAIVVWKDTRATLVQAYAQRVNSGQVKWAAGAVRLCPGSGAYQLVPAIVSDGQYGAIVAWEDWRGANQDIYAQRVSDDAPAINSITPNKGLNNGQIACQINGANFLDPGIHAKLRKGSGPYVYGTNNVIVNPQTMTCDFNLTDMPYGLYDVWVFAGNGQSATLAGAFTVKSFRPVIQDILPLNVKPGDLVTITGGGFGDTRGPTGASGGAAAPSYVSFGGLQASSYTQWTDTQIKCLVPAGATTGNVTITTAVGTSNAQSIKVGYPTWYLAEGSTAWGFSEYITIENPNATSLIADITYMPTEGANVLQAVNLPANSQTTVNPADKLGQKDFSTMVVCRDSAQSIAVDRTMKWTGQGASYQEEHSSIGVTAPNTAWYLPEGSSSWGFECWILVQNPGAIDANVEFNYMIEGTGAQKVNHLVKAHSRQTFNMATDIGSHDASVMIVSNQPIIPERAMYKNDRREGHDSIGTTDPATNYFLAEGTTAWGFTTYVLVQNPWATATDVTITYMTPTGPKAQPKFSMPGNSRKTIRVNDISPANGYAIDMSNTDFSTKVTGSNAIIAERAMYWGAGTNTGEACHDSIGMSSAHTSFYLPDGQATPEDGPVETWTLVQNPNNTDVKIQITYLTPDGSNSVVFTDTVAKNSRKTYNMQDKIDGRAAIKVVSQTAGMKIMVERAMYWQGKAGGANTIGGFSD